MTKIFKRERNRGGGLPFEWIVEILLLGVVVFVLFSTSKGAGSGALICSNKPMGGQRQSSNSYL